MLCKRFKTSVENGLTDELVEAGIKVDGCPIMIENCLTDKLVEAWGSTLLVAKCDFLFLLQKLVIFVMDNCLV